MGQSCVRCRSQTLMNHPKASLRHAGQDAMVRPLLDHTIAFKVNRVKDAMEISLSSEGVVEAQLTNSSESRDITLTPEDRTANLGATTPTSPWNMITLRQFWNLVAVDQIVWSSCVNEPSDPMDSITEINRWLTVRLLVVPNKHLFHSFP